MSREKIAWTIGVGTAGFAFLFLYPSLRAWLTLRARFLYASVCWKNAENCACSAGHRCFFVFFSLLLSNVTRTSRSRHACLILTEKRRKIAPFLQIQASSMKLIVVFFLYTKVFHFDKKKKRKKALRPDSFLFQWFWHFLKYFNSNHNLPSYSLFSKCFWWFFYLGVHRGTGVFCVVFVILLPSRVTHPRARFAPASVWPKNAEKLRLFCRSRPP